MQPVTPLAKENELCQWSHIVRTEKLGHLTHITDDAIHELYQETTSLDNIPPFGKRKEEEKDGDLCKCRISVNLEPWHTSRRYSSAVFKVIISLLKIICPIYNS